MKEFKNIAIALVGFCVCFLVLDFGVGKFFDWTIKQMPSEGERVAKSEYVINKVDADFLVIGSSRAEAHYDSKVIKEAFPDYSVFNCGVDGQLFYYANTAFNCIMDRYTPKVVVWDFQLKDLVEDEPENLSLIYPYYHQNKTVKAVLDEQDATLKYILWNNSYRYNGTASRILRAMRMSESNTMGYLAHPTADVSRKFKVHDVVLKNQLALGNKIKCLDSTLYRANEKGIKVVLCISPMYNKIVGESGTIKCLRELSEKYDMQFVDASQLEEFIHSDKYWYDAGHLNAEGATGFTRKMLELIEYNRNSMI